MKTLIDDTHFGSITISGECYDHDVVIRLDGSVKKRKKKLSKAVYGTSHTISREEMEYVYEPGAKTVIIGTGQSGCAELSDDAAEFLRGKGCAVTVLPTPAAMAAWNRTEGGAAGLFHVTC